MFKLLKLVLATLIAKSQENNKLLGHLHGRPQQVRSFPENFILMLADSLGILDRY